MNSRRMWQMVAMVGLGLVMAGTRPLRGDFRFGTPTPLGPAVNSADSEFDPDISADGLSLYFQSDRPGGYGDSDLYVATRATTEDEWGEAVNLGPYINTAARELGPNISADGLSLYFSSTRDGGAGGNDLYVATRESLWAPWGTPVNLGPVVNSAVDDVSPCISADGLSLYFSDWDQTGIPARPGGIGQADLWVSRRTSPFDPWSMPTNLGRTVNSTDIEGAPDISHDGLMLLFSGYRNGGSWDLWVCTQDEQTGLWGAPVNLGPSVNSTTVDLNPSISADGRMLYFVSFRSGGLGNSDLWQVPVTAIVDFNGDGRVDDAEVRILLQKWGTDEPLCDIGPTPFGDGIVDMQDLAVLTRQTSADVFDPTLAACWGFDETEGAVACDKTETCSGTLMGGALWQPGAGVTGGAILLDGIDDHVAAGYPRDLTTGPFSVLAWVKGGKAGQVILSQQMGANWLVADASTGGLMTDLKSAGRLGGTLCSPAVITDGNWHRIGLVWDGVTRRLYVDGRLVAEDMQTGLKNVYAGLNIGCGKNLSPGSFWSGLIDDVRIYNRVVQP